MRLPEFENGCYNWRVIRYKTVAFQGVKMKLSREEVLHIARLARVALTDAEITRMSEQLSDLLEHFEVLQQVDTTDVPPTAQSIDLQSVMRADDVIPSLPPDEILANAPRREEDYFRVRPVLE
jgi:aspartyl-tRNA(Asn)/glutamyl-tRNA(Gln) amidotransferase subunit C